MQSTAGRFLSQSIGISPFTVPARHSSPIILQYKALIEGLILFQFVASTMTFIFALPLLIERKVKRMLQHQRFVIFPRKMNSYRTFDKKSSNIQVQNEMKKIKKNIIYSFRFILRLTMFLIRVWIVFKITLGQYNVGHMNFTSAQGVLWPKVYGILSRKLNRCHQ